MIMTPVVLETITILAVYCIKTNKLNSDISIAATVGLKIALSTTSI